MRCSDRDADWALASDAIDRKKHLRIFMGHSSPGLPSNRNISPSRLLRQNIMLYAHKDPEALRLRGFLVF